VITRNDTIEPMTSSRIMYRKRRPTYAFKGSSPDVRLNRHYLSKYQASG
jgi:hypothetical protein